MLGGLGLAKPKPLIIVESPAKAKTISRFLGSKYQVKASMGHVRDLPKSQFGVSLDEGFTPRYITIRGKGPLLKELKEAAKKTDRIYLATDPDREGEAISWHLAESLRLPVESAKRIEFHEITKDAVTEAIRHARPINMGLVDAQQARRVLDRIVGYQLSPLLWRKVRPGLSAGRVQSAALKILIDREDAILAFTPEEYFTISLRAGADSRVVQADYAGPLGERGRISGEESQWVLGQVAKGTTITVKAIKTRERRRFPALPFTTSTLQQEASRRLGFSVKRTMSLAQQLYEGLEVSGEGIVGLVTYIRTDSTRVAEVAQAEAEAFIKETFGAPWLKGQQATRPEKVKPGVQGAHEAIRPTVVMRHPDAVKNSLGRDQLRLYRLIWERFVASQMAPEVYDATTVDLEVSDSLFRAHGSVVKFKGFTELYEESVDQDVSGTEEAAERPDGGRAPLPILHEGETLSVLEITADQHFTEPPPRFSEASLVKTLEELGIGRPSTYAPIIDTLLQRQYVERQQKRLLPTELGRVVVDLLDRYFPEIVNVSFTAAIEDQLDQVEANEVQWQAVLEAFYTPFAKELSHAEQDLEKVALPEETTDEVCPQCGKPMVVKYGRFGKFLACSGYPECKQTLPFLEKTGAVCPKCEKPLVVRRTRKGRTFYGCQGYPECDFVTWNRPSERTCPRCGSHMAYRKKGKNELLLCLKEGCGYEEQQAQ